MATELTTERLCPECNRAYLRKMQNGEWWCSNCHYDGGAHRDDCNVWVPTEWAGVEHLDPSRDCTCGATRS